MNEPAPAARHDLAPRAGRAARTLPGEEGIWILVLGDMIVFAMFFTVYLMYRADEVPLFERSQRLLSVPLGVANTLVLLTSSWFVFLGVEAVRTARTRRARLCLGAAFVCGLSFVALKMVEYFAKFAAGITLVTDHFFMYYFMFTGIHLVHVAIGLLVLALLYRKASATAATAPAAAESTAASSAAASDMRWFENGATFWHMVDLLWIMLFPLLYLVR